MKHVVHLNKKKAEQTANPSKYPQGYFNNKPCKTCKKEFSPMAPSNMYCGDECADIATTKRYLKKNYKMTIEQYKELVDKHNGSCAICGGAGFEIVRNQRSLLIIDHCHSTGVVRGLLCHNCNRALGLFKDSTESLKKAISYLERATTISSESTLK